MKLTAAESAALESALNTAFSSMTDEEITAMLKEQYEYTKQILNTP